MDGQQSTLHKGEGRGGWRIACGLGLLTVTCAVGCEPDHRVDLDEFLLNQQQAAAAAAAAPDPAAEAEIAALVARQMGPYQVGPNDVLTVTLTGADPSALFPPVEVRVDRDGNIAMPIVGKIHVGGQALGEAENLIISAYVPSVMKDLVVHVELLAPETTHVLVHGAVLQPGLVQLRRTERNLLYAIVGAGGVSDAASGVATLRRICRPNEPVALDLTNPEQLRAALALESLEDGDIVQVEAAPVNQIMVYGLVNFPQPQVYPPRTQVTALQAIAAAGGLRTDVTPKEATLIRRMPDGTDAHVRLDLGRMSTGEAPNILLAAGDILWVPDTAETRVQDFINKNFFIRAGVNANVSYNVTGIEYLNRAAQQSGFNNRNTSSALNPLSVLSQSLVNQLGATPAGP